VSEEPDALLSAFMSDIFAPLEPGDIDGAEIAEHPIETFAKAVTEIDSPDSDWLQEIGTALRVELSQDFLKRSDARLERIAEKVRKLFGPSHEEVQEAVLLAKSMLQDEREAILAGQ
jgi:hypothetical protein